MAITAINTLKNWFKTGFVPTQDQFWSLLDSFRYKLDKVPVADIEGLDSLLTGKASANTLTSFMNQKGAASGIAPLDAYLKILAQYLPIIDDLESGGSNYVASAETVKQLKILFDSVVIDSISVGAITPEDTDPLPAGKCHGFTFKAGTYALWGNKVVPANSMALLSSDGVGGFKMSLTEICFLEDYTPNTEITLGNQIFDGEVLTAYYLENSTGDESPYAEASCTKSQVVLPNTVYSKTTLLGSVHCFTSDDVYISTLYTDTFTTPSNCTKIRCNITLTSQFSLKDSLMINIGSTLLPYEPYVYSLKVTGIGGVPIKNTDKTIYSKTELDEFYAKKSLVIIRNGNFIYIRSSFNENKDLIQVLEVYKSDLFSNNVVNFSAVYLIDKTDLNIVDVYESGVLLSNPDDDVAPSNFNGTFIGANHGCSDLRVVTSIGHGKQPVDVGSKYIDTLGVEFYIIRVVDANTLWMLSENTSVTDIWAFNLVITGNLTHSANGTNTSNIIVSSYVGGQLLPAVKNQVKKVFIDNDIEIIADGTYTSDCVNIVNNYDVVNPALVLSKLIAQVGTNYSDAESMDAVLSSANPVLSRQINYNIQKNAAIVITTGLRNYLDINLGYDGFLQMDKPSTLNYPNLKLYIPKSLPISDGITIRDFRTIVNWDSAPAIGLDFTAPFWENTNSPPERYTQIMVNSGVNKIGMTVGYDLSKGTGNNLKDLVSSSCFLWTSKKIYPHAIDNKLGTIAANTWYSNIAYRVISDVSTTNTNKSLATNFYYYKVGRDVMVAIDYHTAVSFDALKLPNEFIGMTINLVEKSTNMTIHTNEVLQSGITASLTGSTYGYAILKLN